MIINPLDLSDDDRLAYMLMGIYEKARQKVQSGYRIAKLDGTILQSPVFSQFRTVALWLVESGFDIKWCEINWIGYVEFCFTHLKPTIPHPGQLKNSILFKKYLTTAFTDIDHVVKTKRELFEVYQKCLHPSVRDLETFRGLDLSYLSYE